MKDKKIEFEAVVKIKDVCFNTDSSIENIKRIIIEVMEEIADVEVLDIISVDIKEVK